MIPNIIDVRCEYTGGGIITFWGKLSNGNWYATDTDDCICEFDVDTNEFMRKLFNDEDFDAGEYEEEHVIRKFYPTEEILNEMKNQLNTQETTVYLDAVLSNFKDCCGEIFYEKE